MRRGIQYKESRNFMDDITQIRLQPLSSRVSDQVFPHSRDLIIELRFPRSSSNRCTRPRRSPNNSELNLILSRSSLLSVLQCNPAANLFRTCFGKSCFRVLHLVLQLWDCGARDKRNNTHRATARICTIQALLLSRLFSCSAMYLLSVPFVWYIVHLWELLTEATPRFDGGDCQLCNLLQCVLYFGVFPSR